ncbi:MAG: aminotransferase class V-fold PLP-dependent enzyme [Planctomycetales bacterium]|nr:aminotransferase class V-fold PLP-dependent enzyme [Planctomycetales bacterium]
MPVTAKWAYFDHGAVGPLPEPTRAAIAAWLDEAANQGDVFWQGWSQQVERTRLDAAKLVGAGVEEIALIPNTTTGIGLVAEGFPWKRGDNVVTVANEFPSNLYPWLNLASRGVETRQVAVDGGRVDLNRVAEAIDGRTRLVSLSWVGFASGWRIDVAAAAELCHRRGCLFFLDAIQGLGVFPLDVQTASVDFFAADGHKWLLGPEGAGILYVRREHLGLLRPLGLGWHSVVNSGFTSDMNLRPTAARYEGGTQNMAGMIGLGASLKLLTELGVGPASSTVAELVLSVADYACERLASLGAVLLSPREGANRSGIVTFQIPGQVPAEIRKTLLAEGIVTSCRGGGLRISPHGYAMREEIDRMMEVLRSI